jgi:hypothetical protein
MNALVFALALTASTLVLQTGERILTEGTVREEDGVLVFRSGGVLYSLPASEVARMEETSAVAAPAPVRRLAVSEEQRRRLIEELEKNHSGTAPMRVDLLEELPPMMPEPDPNEEWRWRNEARTHEESVRQAQEYLALLENRVREMQNRINFFFTQGFRPIQFEYDSTELVRAQEQIPYAKLEVERTERAWQQFREDARRAGVLPGWLR